jgi:hypothetical protein
MKKTIFTVMSFIAFSGFAHAAEVHCLHKETVTQEPHQSYDYVTEYTVDGQITPNAGKLKIVSREYSLKQEASGKWVVDYNKKGNVHVDVDTRSNFSLSKTNGTYKVYTTPFRSDRTGAFQYNLAFILNSTPRADGTFSATYAKSTDSDDAPFHEHIGLICTLK